MSQGQACPWSDDVVMSPEIKALPSAGKPGVPPQARVWDRVGVRGKRGFPSKRRSVPVLRMDLQVRDAGEVAQVSGNQRKVVLKGGHRNEEIRLRGQLTLSSQ